MQTSAVREASWEFVKALGFATNPALPELEPMEPRPEQEVVTRTLALLAVVAASYGFPTAEALDWVDRERVRDGLSPDEIAFLQSGHDGRYAFQWRVEALFALAWALGRTSGFDLAHPCPDGLVRLFPDLTTHTTSDEFRSSIAMRSGTEILSLLDRIYCLHWALRDAALRESEAFPELALMTVERRRALEWVMSSVGWDEVDLST